jgi:hypothetical protein
MVSVLVTQHNEAKNCELVKLRYRGIRFDRSFFDHRTNGSRKSFYTLYSENNLLSAIRIVLNFNNIFHFTDFHSFQEDIYQKVGLVEKKIEKLYDRTTMGLIRRYHREFIRIKMTKG